jgi:hypothetical protein
MTIDSAKLGPALVGVAIVGVVGWVAETAISHYPIDDALKVWSALTGLFGVTIGALGAYFFTSGTTQAAQNLANSAQRFGDDMRENASSAQADAANAREVAAEYQQALGALARDPKRSVEDHIANAPYIKAAVERALAP